MKRKYLVSAIVFLALLVFLIKYAPYYQSSSSDAAINNIQMLEATLKSNGYVKVGGAWELPDGRTNVSEQQPSTTNGSPIK
jgi:hypothetical protein